MEHHGAGREREQVSSAVLQPWVLTRFKLRDQVETEHVTIEFLGREDQEALIPNPNYRQRYHESDEQLMLRFGQLR